MKFLSSMSWKNRTLLIFVLLLCNSIISDAQEMGNYEDTSLVKLRQTGYELIYSHNQLNFVDIEIVNGQVLILQKLVNHSGNRLLLLDRNHSPKDTLDINCWPLARSFSQPVLWQDAGRIKFDPLTLYYNKGICELDEKKKRKRNYCLVFQSKVDSLVSSIVRLFQIQILNQVEVGISTNISSIMAVSSLFSIKRKKRCIMLNCSWGRKKLFGNQGQSLMLASTLLLWQESKCLYLTE